MPRTTSTSLALTSCPRHGPKGRANVPAGPPFVPLAGCSRPPQALPWGPLSWPGYWGWRSLSAEDPGCQLPALPHVHQGTEFLFFFFTSGGAAGFQAKAGKGFGCCLGPAGWIINPKCTAPSGRGLAHHTQLLQPALTNHPQTASIRQGTQNESFISSNGTVHVGAGLCGILVIWRGLKALDIPGGGRTQNRRGSFKRLGGPAIWEHTSSWHLGSCLRSLSQPALNPTLCHLQSLPWG